MNKSTPNLFEVLGVRQNATPEEIKKAYRAKAKELRPDLGHNRKAWDEVSEAFRVLSDTNLRAKHKADLDAIAREKAEEGQRSAQFDDMFSGSFGGANVPPKKSSAPKASTTPPSQGSSSGSTPPYRPRTNSPGQGSSQPSGSYTTPPSRPVSTSDGSLDKFKLVLAHLGGACLIALLIAGPFLIADGYDSYDDLVMSFILLLWMGASIVFAIPGAMFAIYLVVQAVIIALDD